MFTVKENTDGYFQKNIVVKKSEVEGLGVFATEDIPIHSVIEAAPYLSFAPSLLQDYFDFYETAHLLKYYVFSGPGGTHAVALGYGSLYNHDPEPNAFWRWREEAGNEAILFYAKRDIKKGEEIFIRYGIDSSRLLFMDSKEEQRIAIIEDILNY